MIFMSLEVQIEELQNFSKHQKQKEQGRKHEEEEKNICDILFQF